MSDEKNEVNGTSGNDQITGTSGADFIKPRDGNDLVQAGDGDDWVNAFVNEEGERRYYITEGTLEAYGGKGNDLIGGKDGDDIIYGEEGDDRVWSKDGNDQVFGGDGDDYLEGGTGNDTLTGGAGEDDLYGGDGDDQLDGGDGADYLSAGSGTDLIYGREGNDEIYTAGSDATVYGGDGDDLINTTETSYYTTSTGTLVAYGEEGNDRIRGGGSGSNELYGGAGDDYLRGHDWSDTLDGGAGVDYLSGGDGDDTLDGGAGDDDLYGGDGNDALDGGAGDDYLSAWSGNDTLTGGTGDDDLYGGDGDDQLDGGDGNDYLSAGSGTDLIYGREGNDRIRTVGSDATVYGGDGDDFINADESGYTTNFSGTLLAYGGAGNDKIGGSVGFDEIYGGDGNDSIWTAEGGSKINGGAGDDKLYGGNGLDEIQGGTGNDRIWGYEGDDQLDGGDGDDYLSGSDGNDTLIGGIGDDELYGGDGDDILNGGTGYDRLYGGDGDDTYIINSTTFYLWDSGGNDTAIVNVDFAKIPSFIENVTYAEGVEPLPYWISALLYDEGARTSSLLGADNVFYFGFPDTTDDYGYEIREKDSNDWQTFSNAQKLETESIFRYIETLIDISFSETQNFNQTNTIAFANNQQESSSGYAFPPGPNATSASDIYFDIYSNGSLRIPTTGSHPADTFIHEIGHALGLKHPFDDRDSEDDIEEPPYLLGTEDHVDWSQMSYTGYRKIPEFSPLDIAALQYIYGVNPNSRSGDDNYIYDSDQPNFIWDGSGTDTINASNASERVTIYLEPGYWGFKGEEKADKITADGQITVNFGTVIENLTGSSYDDKLVGNSADNNITGGYGNDVLYGGDGNDKFDRESKSGDDTFYGGKGNDSFYFTTSYDGGTDTIVEELDEGIDTVHVDSSFSLEGIANVENLYSYLSINSGLTLTGNELNNYIAPSDGSCVIDGKGGDDAVNYYATWAKEQCTIQKEDGVLKVVKGNGSTDTLLNCEYIRFSDQFVVISSLLESLNNLVSGSVFITGTLEENKTLQADTSSIADEDGLGTFSYQWLRNGSAITAATASTYTTTASDIGSALSVTVSYTDGFGTEESITSDSTSPIANVNDPPEGSPEVIRSAENILSVDTSSISDKDGIGAFGYQWLADGLTIDGANGETYDLSALDVGKLISVQISYVDGYSTAETLVSDTVPVTEDLNSRPSGQITLNGSLELDSVLTPDTDGVVDSNGIGELIYFWLDSEGETISSERTLAITEEIFGKTLQLKINYVDGDLFEETLTSESVTLPSNNGDIFNLQISDNVINGYNGIDTVIYSVNLEDVTLDSTASGWEISSENGKDVLTAIERVQFANKKLALDIDGNGGAVAKLLGAFLGAASVQNAEYVGIGLQALDSDTSFEQLLQLETGVEISESYSFQNLVQLALDSVFGTNPSGEALVSTFYQNLTGQTAPLDLIAAYAPLIDSGSLTPIDFATQVIEHPLNSENIDLIGLATTGLEYV